MTPMPTAYYFGPVPENLAEGLAVLKKFHDAGFPVVLFANHYEGPKLPSREGELAAVTVYWFHGHGVNIAFPVDAKDSKTFEKSVKDWAMVVEPFRTA